MILPRSIRKKWACPAISRQGRVVAIAATILFFLISSCAVPTAQSPSDLQTAKTLKDQGDLDRGMEAFQTGRYRKAEKIFGEMSLSEDPLVSRQALYGLSCTRLVLADSPRKYAAAKAQWQSWSRRAPLKYYTEDPRLLTPLLARLAPPAEDKVQPAEDKSSENKPDAVSLKRYKACEETIRELKTRIEDLESQKKLLTYYVDYTAKLEREIWNLKHKINGLEAIDKKILEKKKEISSP